MKGKSILFVLTVICFLTSVLITQTISISQKSNLTPLIDVEIPQEEVPDITQGFKEYSTGLECYMASLELKKDLRNYEINTTGAVKAKTFGMSVDQNLKSKETFYADGSFLCEDITKSKSSLSESSSIQTYYKPGLNTVSVKKTANVSDELVPTYNKESEQIGIGEYRKQFGYLSNENKYNISSKTLKSEKDFVFDGETYTFTLTFKMTVPTVNYKKRIKAMSGASEYPVFSKCEMKLKIDKSGKILSVETVEEYTLKMGLIEVEVKNNMISTYTYYEGDLLA